MTSFDCCPWALGVVCGLVLVLRAKCLKALRRPGPTIGGGSSAQAPLLVRVLASPDEPDLALSPTRTAAAAPSRSPPQRITICGATGIHSHLINGCYTATGAVQNGRGLWQKEGDADKWLIYFGRWYVAETARKDANEPGGWMLARQMGGADPSEVTAGWKVWAGPGLEVQSSVSVEAGGPAGAAPPRIAIRGAAGANADLVNGHYAAAGAAGHGRGLWQKELDEGRCLMYLGERWMVAATEAKEASVSQGWLRSRQTGGADPTQVVAGWEMATGNNRWEAQVSICVEGVSATAVDGDGGDEAAELFAPGDLVRITGGVGHGSTAIVTQVAPSHCTVVILDEHLATGQRELWPCPAQLLLLSSAWRLGARVALEGLTSRRLRHLNGALGTVGRHPREGHPAFVVRKAREPGGPEQVPELRLVVLLDDPAVAGTQSVLVEARCVVSQGASAADGEAREDALVTPRGSLLNSPPGTVIP